LSKVFAKVVEYQYDRRFESWVSVNSKETAAQINNDLGAIEPLVSGASILVIRHALVGTISAGLLIAINWKLTLVMGLLVPAFLTTYLLWGARLKESYKEYRRSSESYAGHLVEFLQTIPMMRVFNTSEHELERVKNKFGGSLGMKFSYFLLNSKRQVYLRILSSSAPLFVAFTGFYFLYFNLATVGQVFAFYGIFAMLIGVVRGGTSLYSSFLEGTIVYDRIRPMLESRDVVGSQERATYSIETIECRGVVYSYNGDRRNKVTVPSFRLNRGEWAEILGDSGAGKTTLVRLMLGVLEPEQGEIRINGIPVCEAVQRGALSQIGYVEQNGYIFSRSLRENILLGRKFDEATWEKTVRIARLGAFIESMPNGADPLLGENGIQISGGERQRILIARALYHQPQWLILDEPFTGIDSANREEIRTVIESLRGVITVILITHQKLPFLSVDKEIVLLRDGNDHT
jgi:ABC-type bacteriocin/lantibiotic exporter with double-glycine peptidase domain